MVEVRQRLQTLFKLDDERTAKLFSGRPMAIRRDLDEANAEKYRKTLLKVGALVELRPSATEDTKSTAVAEPVAKNPPAETRVVADAPEPASPEAGAETNQNPGEAADGVFSLAPVGSDVLKPEERAVVVPVEVDISSLDVDPVGVDLLNDDEKRVIEDLDIDLSHLSIEPPDQ